jgi:hypothetical protein
MPIPMQKLDQYGIKRIGKFSESGIVTLDPPGPFSNTEVL